MGAAQFNDRHWIGDIVFYTDDFGVRIPTKLRSEAWELGDGTPVVLLEGWAGGRDVSRIHCNRQDIVMDRRTGELK